MGWWMWELSVEKRESRDYLGMKRKRGRRGSEEEHQEGEGESTDCLQQNRFLTKDGGWTGGAADGWKLNITAVCRSEL